MLPDAIANIALEDIQSFLKPRPVFAHKGMFGHICVIGGDLGMSGAVRLAAAGALRIGAGMVSVLTHTAHVPIVASACPELLCYGVEPPFDNLKTLLAKASVVILGPGLGQSDWSRRLFDAIITSPLPMVIDADGLNYLAAMPMQSDHWILTPHPSEAARLLQQATALINANRRMAVSALQQRYQGVVVLKGAGTLIANDEAIVCCHAGNPAMASPGMGDLLSGIIAGLLGQGLSFWEAAQAGVLIHATAADRIVAKQGHRGLLASDLLQELCRF